MRTILKCAKAAANRAKSNSGNCKTAQCRCSHGPRCQKFYLHQWGHAFATQMLQPGVDEVQLQFDMLLCTGVDSKLCNLA